ncbi:MAG TPA: hypothetical protein VHN78_14535, partial [Chloroflexota bacterium]|nr:hypothetical protein [Chloroflexota bacterium]
MTDTVATGAAAGRSGERVAAAPAVEVTAPVAPRRATQGIGFYHRAWNKLRRDPVTLAAAAVLG